MKSYYKNAAFLFSMAVPLLILGGLAVACFFGVNRINKKHERAAKKYKEAQSQERLIAEMQQKISGHGAHLKEWKTMLDSETRGTFLNHWKATEKNFSSLEFSRAPHHWINTSDGLGKGFSQPASQVEMKFSSTYRAMQLAFMEIESKLPQLQLDELLITPNNDTGKLNFSTTFTVWITN